MGTEEEEMRREGEEKGRREKGRSEMGFKRGERGLLTCEYIFIYERTTSPGAGGRGGSAGSCSSSSRNAGRGEAG